MGSQFCCNSNGRKKTTEYTWISQLRGIHIFLTFFTCAKYKFLSFVNYSWPLNHMSLNCTVPLSHTNTYYSSTWSMIESKDWEPLIQGPPAKLYMKFWLHSRLELLFPLGPHFFPRVSYILFSAVNISSCKTVIFFYQSVKMLNFS